MNRVLLTDNAMQYDIVHPKKIRKRGKTINESTQIPSKKGKPNENMDEIILFFNQEKQSGLLTEKKLKKKIIEKLGDRWEMYKNLNKF